jgi:hypothetical protein
MQNEQYQCAQSLMLLIIHLFCIYMKKSMFEVQKFHKDTTEWEQNQLGPEDTLLSHINVLTSLSNFHLTASLMIVVHVLPLKMTGSEWPYRPQFHLEMHPLLLPADAS